MPFSVTRLHNPPAILFVQRGARVAAEIDAALSALSVALDRQTVPVVLMMDLRGLEISLEELMFFADAATKRPNALLHHPKLSESLVISGDTLVTAAVSGMASAIYGNARIRSFGTPEEALDHCRAQILGACSPALGAAPNG